MRVIKKVNLAGKQTVSKLRSSTGIYGRRVGGTKPNNAVTQRGRR